jgi:hypothetical protein
MAYYAFVVGVLETITQSYFCDHEHFTTEILSVWLIYPHFSEQNESGSASMECCQKGRTMGL